MPPTLRRGLVGLLAALSLLTVLIGVAHTPVGRPLLGLLARGSGAGACPLGYDRRATPAERASARRRFADGHRGATLAQSRPALGFALGATTRGEIEAWARAHGVACGAPRSAADLECRDVPAALLPAAFGGAPLSALWLDFDEQQRLTSAIAVRRAASAAPIAAALSAITAAVTDAAGPPSAVDADATAARLSRAALAQASAEFRFRDYYALARATNLGDGYVLTEEYRSLRD